MDTTLVDFPTVKLIVPNVQRCGRRQTSAMMLRLGAAAADPQNSQAQVKPFSHNGQPRFTMASLSAFMTV
jgi:hypothetical protein